MSDLFSLYEDNLNAKLINITQGINSIKNLSKEQSENALNQLHNDLKEAERIVYIIIY